MPLIPATRSKTLRQPDQDPVQWKLTRRNEKIYRPSIKDPRPEYAETTIDIAKKFVKLLINRTNKQVKLHEIIQDIYHLHDALAFIPKIFVDYISERASNLTLLLQTYYELSVQLEILALPLHYILNFIRNLDEPLCELFYVHEEIGGAYIKEMDEKSLNDFFVQDGKLFLEWSATMKRERVNRFKFILSTCADNRREIQCLNQLLRLNTSSTDNYSKFLYKELRKTKELILMPSKVSFKQADTMTTKSPVFDLISSWFHEYNPNSNMNLVDFALNLYNSNFDNNQSISDISLIFHIFNTICKRLSMEGKDVLRASDIISLLNDGVIKSFEKDRPEGLNIILVLAQIAFEQMSGTVGYTYSNWFETTFVQANTTILNKKMGILFMNVLQQSIPYEIPSILQVHGKALQHCTTLSNTNIYISSAKQRLLELGVDSSFRAHPQSLKLPIQSILVSVEDEVSEIVQQYKKRNVIPQSLLTSSVFKRHWFNNTFIPNLLSWNGPDKEARDALIEALRRAKKIPDVSSNKKVKR